MCQFAAFPRRARVVVRASDGSQSTAALKAHACRDLERDADFDPEVRQLLDGAGDPEAVRERMSDYVNNADEYAIRTKTGHPGRITVSFREYDPVVAYVRLHSRCNASGAYCMQLDCNQQCSRSQFWLELHRPPNEDDIINIEQVVGSWFMVGKLGGYNSMNMQVRITAVCRLASTYISKCAFDPASEPWSDLQMSRLAGA
jgi:hypothetical protein